MNKRSLRILEFSKIITMLTEYASSPMAKRRCDRIKPQKDINFICTLQEETRDALRRLQRNGNISFSGLKDIIASIKRLEVNGTLTSGELLDIAALLQNVSAAKAYGDGADLTDTTGGDALSTNDCLTTKFNQLISFDYLSSEIHRCILSENEYADDASSTLKSIRKSIFLANERLHSQLLKMIKSDSYKDLLQENLVTMRNGRYCIPVKQEFRSKVPGMIHDQSQTGSTLFIEPIAVVNLNNEIKDLHNKELLEIERILEGLSQSAAAVVEDIAFDSETLTELDFIFARAKFARSYTGTEPLFNTEGIIEIKSGRHPLLEKHNVVPIDIRLGEDYNLLIITGPNTGGKTVSLKTLGLFTLMGQAGLHIPALEGSRLAVFKDVFADIGDEQSIEQNLSTFSSHMSNIVYIVNHATPDCLCLFDELGGGTDPIEGAALAVSILNYLKDMGAKCMVTTHYSELKTYALTTDNVENASCEFDITTLRPTYRLLLGVPGKSNAFAISGRLGLPEYIIDAAKSQLDNSAVDMESLISDLEKNKRDSELIRAAIEAEKKELDTIREELFRKQDEISAKKTAILDKAKEEARELIEEAKETVDKTIRDYNKYHVNPSTADMRKMEAERAGLRDRIKGLGSVSANTPVRSSNHKSSDFHIGDTVEVISLNSRGSVTELPDAKGIVTVRLGILTSRLPISDLLIIPEQNSAVKKETRKSQRNTSGDRMSKALNFSPEINVIGKTVDEAIPLVDKFLDDAFLTHADFVRIVHGKGTGALRNGIHQHLKKLSFVKSYRLGEFGEGDFGVTIVEL